VTTFSHQLNTRTAQIGIPSSAQQQIEQNAGNLGNMALPSSLTTQEQTAVKQAIKQSFVDAFRLLAFISAGLCLVSAAVSALMVENRLIGVDEARQRIER
jgi:hypothetical protein